MKVGDTVLLNEMPGEIVDARDGFYQIEWEPGHDSLFSGRTFWHQGIAFSLGLIVPGENGFEAPEQMKVETPYDPFEEAFQLQLEL